MIEQVVSQLQSWQGAVLRIIEDIPRVPGSLDRHSTTRTVMVMELEQVTVAISGPPVLPAPAIPDRFLREPATFRPDGRP